MYHPTRVAERIADAERLSGFRLEPHTPADCDAFHEHLRRSGRYVYDDKGNPSGVQRLTEFEQRWILNERLLVLAWAEYFLTRYCWVRNEEGVVERYQFRVAQRLLFDIICDLELRGVSIEILILKARQLGMSTIVQLLMAHRIIFSYGVAAISGSADQDKTKELARMMLFCYDSLPVWLRPEATGRSETDRGYLLFGQQASGMRFQHGTQKLGIATGSTPTLYHLSEVAMYADHIKLIDEGLWKAVHASSRVFGVLESTGRGNQGWWADTWHYSKSNWPNSRMCPIFLPWFCGVEMYPKPADEIARPIPPMWHPCPETREHVAMCELYVHSSPHLSRYLGRDYRMPLRQQWYWEWNFLEAKYKGAEASFRQEMAGDDEEALQRSEISVFGNETIALIDRARKRDYYVYGLSGQSIEDDHEPDVEDIDYTAERAAIRHRSPRGETFRWELIPLRFVAPLKETEPDDAVGKLFVWHPPAPGINYSIGVDTAEGKGQDSTAISVWQKGFTGQPDVQVAEFASPWVNHVEAYAFVMAIAAWYGQYMMQDGSGARWRFPYLAVEQVEAVGDTAQLQCMKMGYPVSAVHHWARLDNAPKRIAADKRRPTTKLGWYNFGWARPMLTGHYVHFAQNGWLQVNSPWLIEEMRHWEVHYTASGKVKFEHEDEYHDDRVMAAALAVFPPSDTRSLVDRSKKRTIESPDTLPPIDLGEFSGHVYSTRSLSLTEKSVLTLEDVLYGESRMERFR